MLLQDMTPVFLDANITYIVGCLFRIITCDVIRGENWVVRRKSEAGMPHPADAAREISSTNTDFEVLEFLRFLLVRSLAIARRQH